jgi:hypothetical protein
MRVVTYELVVTGNKFIIVCEIFFSINPEVEEESAPFSSLR